MNVIKRMKGGYFSATCCALLLGLAAFPLSSALAEEAARAVVQEQPASDFEQGRTHYEQGDYEEALQYFSRAAEADPENGDIQYHLGLVYQGILDYQAAEKHFAQAVELDPAMGDGWSHLGEMQYRDGRHAEAKAALEKAQANGARPAYAAYIKGLTLMELGEYDSALESLKKSQEVNPAFRQKAVYAMGMVHSRKNDKKAAEAAFREAIAINPKSAVGVYANFGLQFLHKPQKRLWHVDLNYSIQHDDNVVLSPGGAASALLPSGQKDFTHVFYLHGGFKPETNGPFRVRADASYYKSLHQKLSNMDVDGLSLSVTPAYAMSPGVLSLEARMDYYLVGRQRYMLIKGAYPSFSFDVGNNQHGMLHGGYQKKQYAHQRLTDAAEDRDADNYSAGYTHYLYFANKQGYAGFGYDYDNENTRGNNWDYAGHKFTASALYPFGNGMGFRFSGDYYVQNYRSMHSIFAVKRRDKILSLSPMLTYDLKWATLQLQYTHVQAKSNVRVYDYSRNIVSAGIQFSY